MTKSWGRSLKVIGSPVQLFVDEQRIHGAPIDITNFDEFVLECALKNVGISTLLDPQLDDLPLREIRNLQSRLLTAQLQFSYKTTPAIKFLWDRFGVSPEGINSWHAYFTKVLPITKAHQRLLGWQNFLPAPIAEYVLEGAPENTEINPNFHIEKRKWTGGTSAREGKDYVYVIIPKADWRASVQTMVRIAKPLETILQLSRFAATTYDRRHIAEPIFEDQLRGYGIHLLAKPAGASDQAFLDMLRENKIEILVAPPIDHPSKGQGIPGALKNISDQLKLVLMSSATPMEDTLKTIADSQIAVLNVGGDTGSLPTYYALALPDEHKTKMMEVLRSLKVIQVAPAFTEIANPLTLRPAHLNSWGVLLQTNYVSVWENGKYATINGKRVWLPDGTNQLVPALKTQMIRSSATGNLVFVNSVDGNGYPISFNHVILRYNDFELDASYKPVLGIPRSSGGSATGGCAA